MLAIRGNSVESRSATREAVLPSQIARGVTNRAFTIVELLIVVAIIALLIAILFPSLSKARSSARLAACASNLRQVGVGLSAYLNTTNDQMPFASAMPSIGPGPLDGNDPIYIADVLGPQVGHQEKVFQCMKDQADGSRPAPNQNKSYFASERSSYEYQTGLGGTWIDVFARSGFSATTTISTRPAGRSVRDGTYT